MKKIFLSLTLIFASLMISGESVSAKSLDTPVGEDISCSMTQTTTVTTNTDGTTTTIVDTHITCDTMAELLEFVRLQNME
jgi:hypothetical protein